MSEQDKLRIGPLDDKSDYGGLWHIRILAALDTQQLNSVILA